MCIIVIFSQRADDFVFRVRDKRAIIRVDTGVVQRTHISPDPRRRRIRVRVCGVSTHNEKLAKSTTIRGPQRPCESNGSPMGPAGLLSAKTVNVYQSLLKIIRLNDVSFSVVYTTRFLCFRRVGTGIFLRT